MVTQTFFYPKNGDINFFALIPDKKMTQTFFICSIQDGNNVNSNREK